MTTLKADFLYLHLKNPLVLASGILGTSASLIVRCARAGAGAVTSKSCGPEARKGHENPVAIAWGGGVINAIGLTNPGVENEVLHLREAKKSMADLDVPLFASIFASTLRGFGEVARIIAEAAPDLIEVNISCPNVGSEFGMPFSATAKSAGEVTREVRRAVNLPISIKLSPNVPDIGSIAYAVSEEGADAITAVNTMPAMLIDAYAAVPILKNRTGGLSGPPLKPIALRCVAEIASRVSLPIIGTGGISTGLDAIEMLMAGANLIGLGSAFWQDGPDVFKRITLEMTAFMESEGYQSLEENPGKGIAVNSKGLFTVFRVQEVRFENSFTRTILFNAPLPDSIPGQFVMAWLPEIGEKPFSISGSNPLALTVADIGPFSHALNQLSEGERVWIRGPFGKGFILTSQSSLLVGGGYGAAPLSLLAKHLRLKGAQVAVALGARTGEALMMITVFESLGCQVYLATEDGSAGVKGLVTSAVKQACSEVNPDTLYACGPPDMLVALGQFALMKNLPAQLSFEALIRCGVGLCGSCELSETICEKLGIPEGFLVCHDGPVAMIA